MSSASPNPRPIFRAVTERLFGIADPVGACLGQDQWPPAVELACHLAVS
jgi:hypothetical protein